MVSIRIKFTSILVLCVVVVSFGFGALSIARGTQLQSESIHREIELLTTVIATNAQGEQHRIETAVAEMDAVILTGFNLSRAQESEEYFHAYQESLNPIIKKMGENTKGSLGAYVYFMPEKFASLHYIWYIPGENDTFVWKTDQYENVTGYLFLNDTNGVEDPNNAWYFGPILAEHGIWTPVYIDSTLGIASISYVQPMYVDGVMIGMQGMDMSFEAIRKSIEEVKVFDSGYAFLLDQEGNIIVEPKRALPADWESMQSRFDQQKGMFEYEDNLWYYARLQNNQMLIVVIPEQEALRPIAVMRREFIFTSIVFAVVIGLIGAIAVNILTRRILALRHAADKATDGDFTIKMPLSTSRDELSDLTASVEMLLQAFKQSRKK